MSQSTSAFVFRFYFRESKMTFELDEFSSVVGDIYDASIDEPYWDIALSRICAYVGGYSATLFWHDAANQNAKALYLYNDDPEYTRLYFEKYVSMDPFFPASSFVETGVVHGANDIIPQAELEQTRFYKEWIEPQGIADAIAVNLEKGINRSSFIVVRTDVAHGVADNKMRNRLATLVPHLQRAVSIGQLFYQKDALKQDLTETLTHVESAVLLVGSHGEIVFKNDLARLLLNEGFILQQRDGALRAVDESSDRILREVFAAAKKGDASTGAQGVAIPLGIFNDENWYAHVLPLKAGKRREANVPTRAVAGIFIRKNVSEQLPPLEVLATRYKFTASEVRVLAALMKTSGVKAIADLLGLSEATVKTHLAHLFRKTETSRQSELLKLVNGI
jgi:DNA-binding CsgD family transcriptional regulator